MTWREWWSACWPCRCWRRLLCHAEPGLRPEECRHPEPLETTVKCDAMELPSEKIKVLRGLGFPADDPEYLRKLLGVYRVNGAITRIDAIVAMTDEQARAADLPWPIYVAPPERG